MSKLSASLSILLATIPLASAAQSWEPTGGPLAGEVNALIVADGTVLAGSRTGGIFRSEDSGDNWSKVDGATESLEQVTGFAMNSSGTVFASTSWGARRSSDNGSTWELRTDGLPGNASSAAILVDQGNRVFLAIRFGSVFRSEDGGDSWAEAANGLVGNEMKALALAPDATIYAGTSAGIFKSSTHGDSWEDISAGFTSDVQGLAVEGDSALWAVGFGGVYRLANGVWDRKLSDSGRSITTTPSGEIIAGFSNIVRVTNDGGSSWSEYTVDSELFNAVQALYSDGSSIWAGTSTLGVFRSSNNGQDWEPLRNGFKAALINEMAVEPSGYLFAAGQAGIFRSSDAGASWERTFDGLPFINIEGIVSFGNGLVLAGTNNDGIFVSNDSGDSWTKGDESLIQIGFRSFAQLPDGTLFAGSRNGVVVRSRDAAVSWDSVDATEHGYVVEALGVDANGVIYAGSRQGVRRSMDGGDTWDDANEGLPILPDITDMIFMPDGDVVMTCYLGVYRSSNAGETWTKLGTTPGLGLLTLARDSEGVLYVGIRGIGAAASTDEGQTWSLINAGLSHLDVTSMVVVPNAGKRNGFAASDLVYAGTRGGSVFRLVSVATSAETTSPSEFSVARLVATYPNPVTGSGTVSFQLARPEHVAIQVMDVLGREVSRVVDRNFDSGAHTVRFDASGLPSGAYWYRLVAGTTAQTRQMTVVR